MPTISQKAECSKSIIEATKYAENEILSLNGSIENYNSQLMLNWEYFQGFTNVFAIDQEFSAYFEKTKLGQDFTFSLK